MLDRQDQANAGVIGDIALAVILGLLMACLVAGIRDPGLEGQGEAQAASIGLPSNVVGDDAAAPTARREPPMERAALWAGRQSRSPGWRPK